MFAAVIAAPMRLAGAWRCYYCFLVLIVADPDVREAHCGFDQEFHKISERQIRLAYGKSNDHGEQVGVKTHTKCKPRLSGSLGVTAVALFDNETRTTRKAAQRLCQAAHPLLLADRSHITRTRDCIGAGRKVHHDEI